MSVLLSEKKTQSAQPFSFPMKTRFVEISKLIIIKNNHSKQGLLFADVVFSLLSSMLFVDAVFIFLAS